MSDALLHTISNVLVLVLTAGIGWLAAQTGKLDDTGRITTAKIVNLSIPFFLFNSVTTKFTHDQLVELLGMAWLPFVTVCLNLLISLALIRLGLVRRELSGTFTAAFTGSTVLFVGVPMTTALFGEEGIPYLLVYFFANCVFIWTVGLYAIQTDGVAKTGGARPKLVSMKSVRMLFSPPLLSFIVGIAFVVLSIPIPHFVAATVKSFGSVTSPLALFFIGMTIFKIGVSEAHAPRTRLRAPLLLRDPPARDVPRHDPVRPRAHHAQGLRRGRRPARLVGHRRSRTHLRRRRALRLKSDRRDHTRHHPGPARDALHRAFRLIRISKRKLRATPAPTKKGRPFMQIGRPFSMPILVQDLIGRRAPRGA